MLLQAKPATTTPKAEQQCKHAGAGATTTSSELAEWKKSHCTGYNHIDLSNTDVKNIAIYYLKNDLLYDNKKMIRLKHTLRYDIKDESCPAAPLFTAKDISIQQVNMDTLSSKKEWIAVVNLNTKDENSYLRSELPYCELRKYLIGAKVQVKAYIDNERCCDGWKDYEKCVEEPKCENKLTELKGYSKDIVLTGTQYRVKSSRDNRRRRLLNPSNNERC